MKKIQSTFVLMLAASLVGCAGMQNSMHSDRAPAQANAPTPPTTVTIDVAQAAQFIGEGRQYTVDCTANEGNLDSPITVTFETTSAAKGTTPAAATVYTLTTPLGQFIQNVQNIGLKYVDSGTNKYRYRYGDFYSLGDNNKKVRVYSIEGDLVNTCSSANNIQTGSTTQDMSSTSTIRSIVGPYASYESNVSSYTVGAAHDQVFRIIQTVNVDAPKAGADAFTSIAGPGVLTDLVTPDSLLHAMKNDAFLKKRLGASLAKQTDFTAVYSLMTNRLNGCDIYVDADPKNTFSQFAVFDYTPATGQVSVRQTFTYGCEAMRGNMTQLGWVVTPTAEFKEFLDAEVATAAKENRKPYFMRYLNGTKNKL